MYYSKIPEILSARNISVNQLSKLTGISRTTLTPLKNSSELPKSTRLETLQRIAESLNLEVRELLIYNESVYVSKIFHIVSSFNRLGSPYPFIKDNDSTTPVTKYLGISSVYFPNRKRSLWFSFSANTLGYFDFELLGSLDFENMSTIDNSLKSLLSYNQSLNSDIDFLSAQTWTDYNNYMNIILDAKFMIELQKKTWPEDSAPKRIFNNIIDGKRLVYLSLTQSLTKEINKSGELFNPNHVSINTGGMESITSEIVDLFREDSSRQFQIDLSIN